MIDVLDYLTRPAVAVPLVIVLLYQAYAQLTAISPVPTGLPWIGRDFGKIFSETRAHLSSFNNVREWLAEGYGKYSKNGRSYILPDFSGKPEVIIPRSQVHWLLEQPDDVLSASAFHYDSLEGTYAFTTPQILKDPYHEHVVHKNLARRLPTMIPYLSEEIASGFDEAWGHNTESWNKVCVFDTVMFMVSRAVNRMIVGAPLCKDEDYLSNMRSFATDIMTTGAVLRFIPTWLKPVVGPLVAIPNNIHYRNTAKYTLPLITERLRKIQRKHKDPGYKWEEPNDFVSWTINVAMAEDRQDELTPDMISRRLMPINFASIHTTTLTVTNCLFDLLASDDASQTLEGIREESARVFTEEGGHWNKVGLARCHRADSAFRESLRVSNFMTRNLVRKVLPSEGIENKTEGWRAPQGVLISHDMHSVQHDPDIYPDPNTYDAFRFSRPREQYEAQKGQVQANGSAKTTSETLELKNTGLVTTSEIWLPFSHGRHACPGRFLIAIEVKMMLAYMVMNYDIEPLAARPPNSWFGQMCIPPTKATIRVRRKKELAT